jgi:hypothetical protein
MRDLLNIFIALALGIGLFWIIRWRRRSHAQFLDEFTDEEVCEHLKDALALLKSRGHVITQAGQKSPDMPLELHLAPPFDPQKLAEELKLNDPVFVSERNVLYCKEDWCELHPK